MIARFLFLFTLLTFLASYKAIPNLSGKGYEKITGTAQGTTYTITFDAKRTKVNYKIAVDSIFKVIDQSMSLWDKNSIISNFNKKSTDSQEIDEHFRNVLLKSFEIYKQSEGAFDPTIGHLVKSWGFISKNDLPLPSDRTIDSLKQFVGLEKVSLIDNKVVKQNPAIQLDFNAIAQGYTVDVLALFLENKGIENYLVEVGGELRAKGKNSEGKNWKIGIEKPIDNKTESQNELQSVLALSNMSLATSGNYRNFVKTEGKHFSHILNPKTGRPIEHDVLSVSVLAPTAAEADAWDTVFMVLGKEKSIEMAKKFGLEIQIISAKNNGFDVFQTEGFKKLIQ